ncbi:MAG: DUF2157 domain-containing protein [Bdellovibrionaceae bacterium]|nr:DUF2157 domain-containing protein [Pseudobdellovibrionaceae bacterium]
MNNLIEQNMTSSRAKLIARTLKLDEKSYNKLIEKSELRPSIKFWLNGLDRVLLIVTSAFLLSGILCFLSYNWMSLHKFVKFALLETGVIITIAMAWYKGIDQLPGKVFLFSGAMFVGFSLAVFGQIYQTGADPYGLFLSWLIFVTAWTVIAKQSALYVLFIVLSNLSLVFYWNQIISPPSITDVWMSSLFGPLVRLFIDSGRSYLPLLLLVINLSFMVIYEFTNKKSIGTLAVRVSGIAAIIPLTSSAVILLFTDQWQSTGNLLLVSFFASTILGLWYFRFRCHDLFLTACILLALIVFITSFLLKSTDFGKMGIFSFFFIGLAVLVQTGSAAYWLRITNSDRNSIQ